VIDEKYQGICTLGEVLHGIFVSHHCVVFTDFSAPSSQRIDHPDRRALPYVGNVGFVCFSERNENCTLEPTYGSTHDIDHVRRHSIVDFTRGRDQTRHIRGRLNDEPWVDRDAVTANARSWAQKTHSWMPACEADGLPDIHSDTLGNESELIGQCNVDVAMRVLHEFDELRRSGISLNDFAGHERAIQL
jgi:hypothetical protein